MEVTRRPPCHAAAPAAATCFHARAGIRVLRPGFKSTGGMPSSDRGMPAPAVGLGAGVPLASREEVCFDTTYSFPSSNNAIESFRMTFGLTRRF